MSRIKSKTITVDVNSWKPLKPEEWDNSTVQYLTERILTKISGHNPIVSVNLLPESSFYSLKFKVEYISKDSTATRYANFHRIREQLLMECV